MALFSNPAIAFIAGCYIKESRGIGRSVPCICGKGRKEVLNVRPEQHCDRLW